MKPILVISHERSGTHFLINSIALNFGLSESVINLDLKDQSFLADSLVEPDKIRKSHHQAFWLSNIDIQELTDRYSVFYIIRDCRAVLTSIFHYYNTVSKFVPGFRAFDNLADLLTVHPKDGPEDVFYSKVKSVTYPERWVTHIDSWEPFFDRLCVVTYRDLSLKFDETIWRIAAFLRMTPNRVTQKPGLKTMYSVTPYRGIYCGWKEEMSQRMNMEVWKMTEKQRKWMVD